VTPVTVEITTPSLDDWGDCHMLFGNTEARTKAFEVAVASLRPLRSHL
jgi:hypothetical protein